jgi:pimeloyl-ACP methyl ester carboxylesterase
MSETLERAADAPETASRTVVTDGAKIRPGRYFVERDEQGVPLRFFMHIRPGSRRLLIFGQGYTDRNLVSLPRFQRMNWASEFDDSVVILNDPTLYLDPRMGLGWCLGTAERYYLPIICDYIAGVADQLGVANGRMLFWGSSAGGFTSLMMATYFPGAVAVVNNPQVDVLAFKRGGVRKLLAVGFGGIDLDTARKRFATRFSFVERVREIGWVPDIYYLQNLADEDHYRDQFLPLVSALAALGGRSHDGAAARFVADLYRDDVALHMPVGLTKTRATILAARTWADEARLPRAA